MKDTSLSPPWFSNINWIKKETTDLRQGTNPLARTIEELLECSIINLDKPQGPTSHDVVHTLKQILKVAKAGHRGTLDPQVSGVLPIGINKATKLLDALLQGPKEYIAVMKLHDIVSTDKLLKVIKEFEGKIYQTPPLASNVKKVLRIREIYQIEILEVKGKLVLMKILCESGTYIRTLCVDIGRVLGVGAHMAELRRTRSASFNEEKNLVTLNEVFKAYLWFQEMGNEDLLRKVLLPPEMVVAHLKKVVVSDTTVDALCHGAPLARPGITGIEGGIKKGDLVAVFTLKGEIIGLALAEQDITEMKEQEKGIVARMRSVVMKRGTYHSAWKKNQ